MGYKKNNNTITHIYLNYHEEYEKKYGNKTLVLMQVGSFHEAYATKDRGYDLYKLSELLDLICTRKDKSKNTIDENNPYMLGFPSLALEKYIEILVGNSFTIVVIDQTTPPPKPKREVTRIISAGTYLNGANNYNYNYIVSLYVEDITQKSGKILTVIGMSAIDLTTGKTIVNESYSVTDDDKYSLDEAVRFIICHNPKEILIYHKKKNNIGLKKQKLLAYLELENKTYKYTEEIPEQYKKLSYQTDFLHKIYPSHGMLNPIEYLNLEQLQYARLAFIASIDYAYSHNENIVYKINKPSIFKNNKRLVLGNNALYQMNILDNKLQQGTNNQFRCLYDVVNNTSTAIGKRFLKDTLSTPLLDVSELENRYKCISKMIRSNRYIKYEKYLKSILDIERLHRKLVLGLLHPYEFVGLIDSYENINKLIILAKQNPVLKKLVPSIKTVKSISLILKWFEKTFDEEEMKKHNLNEISTSFYMTNINKSIDKIQIDINDNLHTMNKICSIFSRYIDNTSRNNVNKVSLKRNDTEGYYLHLTKKRAMELKNKISELDTIQITKTLSIDPKQLVYKHLKGTSKIYFKKLTTLSDKVVSLKLQLMTKAKNLYLRNLTEISEKYKTMFPELVKFVAIIDFIKSGAKTAILYNYIEPKIANSGISFVKCKSLRHPIVERINTDVEYIPNNITLGQTDTNTINGILLYGLNSSGKSTCMKAVGMSIVMAQAGLFVPATEFIYSPYHSLLARITGNDNILKGLSSFALEMTELRAILRRAGPYTLVLGDEVCRGTEQISAISLVASTIERLSKTGSNFIFATHLHKVAEMNNIKKLNNVKAFHLTVDYDKENDTLIFDRILKEGIGEKVYGIKVAKYIIDDDDFIKRAQEIKHELMNTPNVILSEKGSKYNSNVYVDECKICGKKIDLNNPFTNNLDTHHINFQKDCKNGFVMKKPHLPKNSKANLIVLCKTCHHNVHHGKLQIYGYSDTSKGRKIKYNKI